MKTSCSILIWLTVLVFGHQVSAASIQEQVEEQQVVQQPRNEGTDEQNGEDIYFAVDNNATQAEEILPFLTHVKPGFKGRITQKGLDYASSLASEAVLRALKKIRIPNIKQQIGPAYVKVKNVNITKFPLPNIWVGLMPGLGLRVGASEVAPEITADYEADIDLSFWTIYKSGTMEMVGRNLSFALDISIGADMEGRPTVQVVDCNAAGAISATFRGGWSEALNVGSAIFMQNAKTLLYDELCWQATKEINDNVKWILSQFTVTETFMDEYELDFHLTRYPEFFGSALESFHKGVVYLLGEDGRRVDPPFEPVEIPLYPAHKDKMVYVYVTSHLINSGLYAAYHSGRMDINVTMDQVPEESRSYMAMSCEDVCFGSIFPQVGEAYPTAEPMLRIYAGSPPHIAFKEGHAILTAYIIIELHAFENDKLTDHIMTIHLNVTSEFDVELSGRNVTFNIISLNPVAELRNSKVYLGGSYVFNAMISFATSTYIQPALQALGAKGFELPDIKDVTFVNPEVILDHGTEDILIVATDVRYDGPL